MVARVVAKVVTPEKGSQGLNTKHGERILGTDATLEYFSHNLKEGRHVEGKGVRSRALEKRVVREKRYANSPDGARGAVRVGGKSSPLGGSRKDPRGRSPGRSRSRSPGREAPGKTSPAAKAYDPRLRKRSNIALLGPGGSSSRTRCTSPMMMMRRAAPHPAEQVLDDSDFGTTVDRLNELHTLHGEAAMGRLKQFLTIVRSTRAGLVATADYGDPGHCSVERFADLKLKGAVIVLETLAWLWRYLEREFEAQHGRELRGTHIFNTTSL